MTDSPFVPPMTNAHSHAFQRAMAGLAETLENPEDSFWTWRELMYRFAARIGPDDLEAIAAQLYVELLKSGYTTVCEFHYLHHQPDGTPYADPAEMSWALVRAARRTGIRLVLLPTLYMTRGFDGGPLSERQRRFGHDLDAYVALVTKLRAESGIRVGMALHSLRAVPPQAMDALLASPVAAEGPIHIHIAEQTAEVDECLERRGARPVSWLLDHAPVDARWTLVHATHLSPTEIVGIAASGANVAICPTTEANLGDGLFPLPEFLAQGGRFSIGTDSHVSTSVVEELRWLEYGQRLVRRKRNVAASVSAPHVGANLYRAAAEGGVLAAGGAGSGDSVRLDAEAVELAGAGPAQWLDACLFAGNRNLVQRVDVGGRTVIEAGRHAEEQQIAERYRVVLRRLCRGD